MSATLPVTEVPAAALAAPLTSVPELPGWTHVQSGKVRELYIPAGSTLETAEKILVVATDRISAYDYILSTPIRAKGIVLTQLSLWWFEQLKALAPNHLLPDEVPAAVAGRAMICKRLEMYPVECVARGYLTGSGLAEYRDNGQVCGVSLPGGLTEASKLNEPIFTPAVKAELGEHDENVSAARVAELHGQNAARELERLTLALYTRAAEIAAGRGIILADTKFEFGALPGAYCAPGASPTPGSFVLGDEVLTPDSSRFWPADAWTPGQVTPSFDKQYVRDWLTSPASGWDRKSGAQPPALPAEVAEKTTERYLEAFHRLTGRELG